MRRTIGLVRRTTGLHRTQHLVLKHAVFDIRFKHLRPTKPDTSHTNSKLFKSTFQSNNWLLSKINRFQVMSLQNWLKNHFDTFYKKGQLHQIQFPTFQTQDKCSRKFKTSIYIQKDHRFLIQHLYTKFGLSPKLPLRQLPLWTNN